LAPTKEILQTYTEDDVLERARAKETHAPTFWIDADEIVGVSRAKQVGSVAWDSRSGSVWGNPFAPEREVYDNWTKHLGILLFTN
jgi:hypothetical protein